MCHSLFYYFAVRFDFLSLATYSNIDIGKYYASVRKRISGCVWAISGTNDILRKCDRRSNDGADGALIDIIYEIKLRDNVYTIMTVIFFELPNVPSIHFAEILLTDG